MDLKSSPNSDEFGTVGLEDSCLNAICIGSL